MVTWHFLTPYLASMTLFSIKHIKSCWVRVPYMFPLGEILGQKVSKVIITFKYIKVLILYILKHISNHTLPLGQNLLWMLCAWNMEMWGHGGGHVEMAFLKSPNTLVWHSEVMSTAFSVLTPILPIHKPLFLASRLSCSLLPSMPLPVLLSLVGTPVPFINMQEKLVTVFFHNISLTCVYIVCVGRRACCGTWRGWNCKPVRVSSPFLSCGSRDLILGRRASWQVSFSLSHFKPSGPNHSWGVDLAPNSSSHSNS